MFSISELCGNILLYSNAKVLKNICFLNKQIHNICFDDGQFWKNKFEYNELLILDNPPSFQEYIKINDCKDKAEKILLINDIEYQNDEGIGLYGIIKIDIGQNIHLLRKIYPEIVIDVEDMI